MRAKLANRDFAAAMAQEQKDAVRYEAHRKRHDHLKADDLHEQRDGDPLGDQDGHKLVGSRKKDRKERADGNHASCVEGRSRGGHAALREGSRERTRRGAKRTCALEKFPERTVNPRFHRLEDEVCYEQKREKKQGFPDEFDHACAIASLGHCAAQAPQSTHLSGSIT